MFAVIKGGAVKRKMLTIATISCDSCRHRGECGVSSKARRKWLCAKHPQYDLGPICA